MNLLAFIYITIPNIPIPIRTGSGCGVSTLPPYSSGILIAAFIVGFVALMCLCLSVVLDAFGHEDVSDFIFKYISILMTLFVLLACIALLCALIGV